MDELVIARIVHVVAVLFWIGGVGFVTWVVFPAISASELPENRLAKFNRIEGRFAAQARVWVLLAGASGFWLVHRADMWSRFADLHFWWMHAMVALWSIFALMLFVLEPLVLHRRMAASRTPEADFRRLARLHHILIVLAVITLIGAVGGSHGLF
jgi:uncharacterized membrane protein